MDKVRSFDMFGHVVNLNFDQRGVAHKTFIGGFFSIFIRIFLPEILTATIKFHCHSAAIPSSRSSSPSAAS